MEIKVRIEASFIIQEGETNINEILWAVKGWSREMGIKVAEGLVGTYQEGVVELLCAGRGRASWVAHEHKGSKRQMCIGGSYTGGGKRKARVLRTELGEVKVSTPQIVCRTCGKRFRVLNPLLRIKPRSKPTVQLKLMTAETTTDLSYRKGSARLLALAQLEIPKSSAQRWMATEDWTDLEAVVREAADWESLRGILADGTGYKRQKAETTRGHLHLVMGMTPSPRRLVPLGAWADRSWEEIDQELFSRCPEGVKPPVVVMDGEKGQEVLGNLAQGTQRCQWHASHQLGYFLWKDGVAKEQRVPFLEQLDGLMKIELPVGEYQEIPQDLKTEIQERLAKSRGTLDELILTFQSQGYSAASTYLRNAATSMFTVVEKWLELGYMPPKVISLLERVMREVGRRLKKIGASWKEKGLLAVVKVLLARIYTPEQWKQYWDNLLNLKGHCFVKSYSIHFSIA